VTIKVGLQEQTFSVHKPLLTETSTFFKAALDGNFKEAAENEVKLLEEAGEVFEQFFRWLYFGFLTEGPPTNDVKLCTAKMKMVVDLFVLGDKIGCTALRNHAIRNYYSLIESRPFTFPVRPLSIFMGSH
jgi:BTB/POZ domain